MRGVGELTHFGDPVGGAGAGGAVGEDIRWEEGGAGLEVEAVAGEFFGVVGVGGPAC